MDLFNFSVDVILILYVFEYILDTTRVFSEFY